MWQEHPLVKTVPGLLEDSIFPFPSAVCGAPLVPKTVVMVRGERTKIESRHLEMFIEN